MLLKISITLRYSWLHERECLCYNVKLKKSAACQLVIRSHLSLKNRGSLRFPKDSEKYFIDLFHLSIHLFIFVTCDKCYLNYKIKSV